MAIFVYKENYLHRKNKVFYVKRVKGFKKTDIWQKTSCRKFLKVTSLPGYSVHLQLQCKGNSNPPLA